MAQGHRERRVASSVAEELRSILGRRNIKPAILADETGIARSTMSNLLAGASAIDVDQLFRICRVLGVQPGDLFPDPLVRNGNESDKPRADRVNASPRAEEIAQRIANEDTDEELLHRLAGVRAVTGRSQAAMIALETSIRDHWRSELLEELRTLPMGSANSPGVNGTA